MHLSCVSSYIVDVFMTGIFDFQLLSCIIYLQSSNASLPYSTVQVMLYFTHLKMIIMGLLFSLIFLYVCHPLIENLSIAC